MRLQLGLGVAFVVSALGAAIACSNSTSNSSPPAEAGTDACTDMLMNIQSNASSPPCPQGTYEQAMNTSCSQLKLRVGFIRAGQCADYLVWSVFPDPMNATVTSPKPHFTECFYDPSTRALVGAYLADGMTDQCNGTSPTVQGGSVETWCSIATFDENVDCAPKPEAGPDAQE